MLWERFVNGLRTFGLGFISSLYNENSFSKLILVVGLGMLWERFVNGL